MRIAKRVYSLAQDQNDSALMIGAYRALAVTLYYSGRFRDRATIRDAWYSDLALGGVQSPVEEVTAPAVTCLCFEAYPSGISERSPLATRPWRKRSH